MGIFSRMGDIINSNLNAMIDKAENPEKIARLIIQEMEDTLVEVMMRTSVATGQIRMRTVLNDNKVDDALARYERMERKVDELEAHVEAFDLGSGESLESQFAALEADEAIEDELAALKASLKKPAKKAANK